MDKFSIILLCIAVSLSTLLIFSMLSSTWFYQIPYIIQFKINGYTKENAITVCSGKNLVKTSLCLNAFVKGVYKYVPTSDIVPLDFDRIISEGDDCRGWTFVYQTLFNNLGFKNQKVSIPIKKEDNILYKHAFLIVYDETGWCSLDQKDINCFVYKK